VNGDVVSANIFQDALVGSRRAPLVVFWRQTVNRDHRVNKLQPCPFRGKLAKGTRDHLNVNASAFELRQNLVQLAVSNQWIAAHNG